MKQITEDFVSFEIAKLLKDKGFEQIGCEKRYNLQGDLVSGFAYGPVAPTHQMALKWLREVHEFIVTIDYDRYPIDNGENSIVGYGYNIQTKDNPEDYYRMSESVYDSYEEAVEAACLYVLKNM